MAKSILAGFVKGYTGRQLDLIDERRKKDAEKEKILMLEQLRRDTAEWEWTNDPGKKLQREEATQRMGMARSQEERAVATHGLNMRKGEQDLRLDAAKTAADIEQSRAAAAYSRRAAANVGKSGLDGSGSAPMESDVVQELNYKNRSLIAGLTSGENPVLTQDRLQSTIQQIVANSNTPAEADKRLIEYLGSVARAGNRVKSEQTTRAYKERIKAGR